MNSLRQQITDMIYHHVRYNDNYTYEDAEEIADDIMKLIEEDKK